MVVMGGSAYEAALETPVAARFLELVHSMMDTRGATTCPSWTEDEFDNLYNPLIAMLRMLESMDDTSPTSSFRSQCADMLGSLNFAHAHVSLEHDLGQPGDLAYDLVPEAQRRNVMHTDHADYVAGGTCGEFNPFFRLLPPTCTVAKMASADGCSFQLSLDTLLGVTDLNLQVAVATCPGSLLPFISVRLGGAGATGLLAPCSSDDECAADHQCFDVGKSLLDHGNDAAEMGLRNFTHPYDQWAQGDRCSSSSSFALENQPEMRQLPPFRPYFWH